MQQIELPSRWSRAAAGLFKYARGFLVMFAILVVTVFRLRGIDVMSLMTPSFFNAAPSVAQNIPEAQPQRETSASALDHANELVRARLEDQAAVTDTVRADTLPVACLDSSGLCRFWFEYAGELAFVVGSCDLPDLDPCNDTQ